MTGKKVKTGTIDVKALMAGDEEFLRALGAEKVERTASRLSYSCRYSAGIRTSGSSGFVLEAAVDIAGFR